MHLIRSVLHAVTRIIQNEAKVRVNPGAEYPNSLYRVYPQNGIFVVNALETHATSEHGEQRKKTDIFKDCSQVIFLVATNAAT